MKLKIVPIVTMLVLLTTTPITLASKVDDSKQKPESSQEKNLTPDEVGHITEAMKIWEGDGVKAFIDFCRGDPDRLGCPYHPKPLSQPASQPSSQPAPQLQ